MVGFSKQYFVIMLAGCSAISSLFKNNKKVKQLRKYNTRCSVNFTVVKTRGKLHIAPSVYEPAYTYTFVCVYLGTQVFVWGSTTTNSFLEDSYVSTSSFFKLHTALILLIDSEWHGESFCPLKTAMLLSPPLLIEILLYSTTSLS